MKRSASRRLSAIFVGALSACWASAALAATYEVGPGKEYENISDAPLRSLEAGDEVLVYYRAEPYRESFGIERAGTEQSPISLRGIPGPNGELPIIDGEGSSAGPGAHNRGLVHTGPGAAYVVIENFEIRNANSDAGFPDNAASVFAPDGSHLTFRNLDIHGSGNGFFSWVNAADITVEGCFIHDNGNAGSIYEHNIYTESDGIVFQYNVILPLRPDAGGNNLKDRSQGTVVRYNWIEGGNRVLDLVEAEDGAWDHTNDPIHVFGNVLIKHADTNQSQIVHFGQDGGRPPRRLMYFYQNTVLSDRSNGATIFFVNSQTRVEAYNNVFESTGGELELLDPDQSSEATLVMGANWIQAGFRAGSNSATYEGIENLIEGSDPGLGDGYRPASGSPLIDSGDSLPQGYDTVTSEFAGQGLSRARGDSAAPDIGAFGSESMGDPSPGGFGGGGSGGGSSGGGGNGNGGTSVGGGSGGTDKTGNGGSSQAGANANGDASGVDGGCACRTTPVGSGSPHGISLMGLLGVFWLRRRVRRG
ncbi:MAG: right-handed parallel beta-helix repeat-containing protein [Polyangiaceae bacterium]|nr:right-handed parallel beta-helix repeat-containing protein [Myxococcales bacterium]MCB9584533.1 right-handed parallel beta-helix repeat-containing protein [Polyangiaceae bacterium]